MSRSWANKLFPITYDIASYSLNNYNVNRIQQKLLAFFKTWYWFKKFYYLRHFESLLWMNEWAEPFINVIPSFFAFVMFCINQLITQFHPSWWFCKLLYILCDTLDRLWYQQQCPKSTRIVVTFNQIFPSHSPKARFKRICFGCSFKAPMPQNRLLLFAGFDTQAVHVVSMEEKRASFRALMCKWNRYG